MADSKTEAGKGHSETRLSHNVRKQGNAQKLMVAWQKDTRTSLRVKVETS